MRDPVASLLASRAGKLALSLLVATHAAAFDFAPVPSPNIDTDRLGRIAFAGDFDSISLYQYEGQNQEARGPNSALLSRFPNGLFATIQNTDGEVRSMCQYSKDGKNTIVVGGNFTSVDGSRTPGGVALIDPKTGSVTAQQGLTGSVNALHCDNSRGLVYVGGSFEGSNSTNAIVWKGNNNWADMPFQGFDGIVHSITEGPNKTVVFGGSFSGLKGLDLKGNGTAENNTQKLPIGSASITAQTSSGRPGLSDPKVIACKTNLQTQGPDSTWLLADTAPGFWKADFGFGFQPTRLRLYNTDLDGRGTKEFRYTALPDGGIMNLTYTDPKSGDRKFCDARCPLPQGNTTAQDFDFVNNIGMNSFRIDISDWYGNGAGLNAIEIFQTDIYAYAINEFNVPKCGGATSGASATATGNWQSTPSHDSSSRYLTATLDTSNYSPDSTFVVFRPDIPQSGNYTIKMYTPGCQGDGTCATRGSVNITGTVATGSDPSSTVLAQTNDFDKYDEIFSGRVDVANGFKPAFTLAPLPNQKTPTNVLTVVAQRVRFEIRAATDDDDELNGLFEYDPSQQTVNTKVSQSVIDKAGASLDPSRAVINTLTTVGDKLYVGGNFTNSKEGLNHIFSVSNDGPSKLSGNGLNAPVVAFYADDKTIYVGGNFTNTQDNGNGDLCGVAAYSDDKWSALGAGVNGSVTSIVPISNMTGTTGDVLAISGKFRSVRAFGGKPEFSVDGLAIWVPSQKNWLHNLGLSTIDIQGSFSAFAKINDTERFYAGVVSSQALGASGAAVLNGNSLDSFPFSFGAQQQQGSLQKRALLEGQDVHTTGISAALFHKNGASIDKTILAGHFAAVDTDGQNITNVVIIDDKNATTGFGKEVDSNSTFIALGLVGDILFAGGVVTGKVGDTRVAGVVSYDLANNKFQDTQPPMLQGTNVTVNAIAPRINSDDVYVAGRFESAGQLSCPALCIWNTRLSQWNTPGMDISGVVTNLLWISDTKAIVAGNLTVGTNATKIFSYDSTKSQFQELTGSRDLPGPVDALCPANTEGSQLWAAGKANGGDSYLQRFDGNKWNPIDDKLLGRNTIIRGLQALPLSKNHDSTDLLEQNQDLLILGQINITNFGIASAALYNGTALTPFLLSTTSDGQSGSLSRVFVQNENFFQGGGKKLALGFIVLIALAIALALTFLLVVAGILLEWYRKRAAGYSPAPTSYTDRMGNVGRVPPDQLFGTLQGPRAPAI